MPGIFGHSSQFPWVVFCCCCCHSALVYEFQAICHGQQKCCSPCEMGKTDIKNKKPSSAVKIRHLANPKINNKEIFEFTLDSYNWQCIGYFINKTISHTPNLTQTSKLLSTETGANREQLNEQYKEVERKNGKKTPTQNFYLFFF